VLRWWGNQKDTIHSYHTLNGYGQLL